MDSIVTGLSKLHQRLDVPANSALKKAIGFAALTLPAAVWQPEYTFGMYCSLTLFIGATTYGANRDLSMYKERTGPLHIKVENKDVSPYLRN